MEDNYYEYDDDLNDSYFRPEEGYAYEMDEPYEEENMIDDDNIVKYSNDYYSQQEEITTKEKIQNFIIYTRNNNRVNPEKYEFIAFRILDYINYISYLDINSIPDVYDDTSYMIALPEFDKINRDYFQVIFEKDIRIKRQKGKGENIAYFNESDFYSIINKPFIRRRKIINNINELKKIKNMLYTVKKINKIIDGNNQKIQQNFNADVNFNNESVSLNAENYYLYYILSFITKKFMSEKQENDNNLDFKKFNIKLYKKTFNLEYIDNIISGLVKLHQDIIDYTFWCLLNLQNNSTNLNLIKIITGENFDDVFNNYSVMLKNVGNQEILNNLCSSIINSEYIKKIREIIFVFINFNTDKFFGKYLNKIKFSCNLDKLKFILTNSSSFTIYNITENIEKIISNFQLFMYSDMKEKFSDNTIIILSKILSSPIFIFLKELLIDLLGQSGSEDNIDIMGNDDDLDYRTSTVKNIITSFILGNFDFDSIMYFKDQIGSIIFNNIFVELYNENNVELDDIIKYFDIALSKKIEVNYSYTGVFISIKQLLEILYLFCGLINETEFKKTINSIITSSIINFIYLDKFKTNDFEMIVYYIRDNEEKETIQRFSSSFIEYIKNIRKLLVKILKLLFSKIEERKIIMNNYIIQLNQEILNKKQRISQYIDNDNLNYELFDANTKEQLERVYNSIRDDDLLGSYDTSLMLFNELERLIQIRDEKLGVNISQIFANSIHKDYLKFFDLNLQIFLYEKYEELKKLHIHLIEPNFEILKFSEKYVSDFLQDVNQQDQDDLISMMNTLNLDEDKDIDEIVNKFNSVSINTKQDEDEEILTDKYYDIIEFLKNLEYSENPFSDFSAITNNEIDNIKYYISANLLENSKQISTNKFIYEFVTQLTDDFLLT